MAEVFTSGFENAPSTGSSFENLTDNGAWDDIGGSGATIVNTFSHAGAKCLQMTFPPDGSVNGPDFRAEFSFAQKTLLRVRWYQYFSSNYYFRQSDHKMVILGLSGSSQDIYLQLRGSAGNQTAKLAVHVFLGNGGGHVYESSNITVTRGAWHLFEATIRTNGAIDPIDFSMDGVEGTMVAASGGPDWTTALQIGSVGIGYFKWDTTYNGFNDPAVQAAAPFVTWLDDVAIDDADAPASVPGGGSEPPPIGPSTPTSPSSPSTPSSSGSISSNRPFRLRAQAIAVPRGEAAVIPIVGEFGSPAPTLLFTLAASRNATTKLYSAPVTEASSSGYLLTVPSAITNREPGVYWWDVWDTETPQLRAIGSLEIHKVVRLP